MEFEVTTLSDSSSPEEKRHELFTKQKQLLDTFLAHGAISQQQYDISLGELKAKMGFQD